MVILTRILEQGVALTLRCWFAAHMCVKLHFRTCDVRAEVRAERVCELCMHVAVLFILVDMVADEYVNRR